MPRSHLLVLMAALGVAACGGSSTSDGDSSAGGQASSGGNASAGSGGNASAGRAGAGNIAGAATTGGSAGRSSGGGSGSGGAPTTSGIDGSQRLDAVTAADRGKLCDVIAAKYGGYGREIECDDGTTLSSGYDNQAQCLAEWPQSCAVTVATFEQCLADTDCDGFAASCSGLFDCQ